MDGYDGYANCDPEIVVVEEDICITKASLNVQDQIRKVMRNWGKSDGYDKPDYYSALDGYINLLREGLIREGAQKFIDDEKTKTLQDKEPERKAVPAKSEWSDKKRDREALWRAVAAELSRFPKTSPIIFSEALELANFVNSGRLLETDIEDAVEFGVSPKSIQYYRANCSGLRAFCGYPLSGVSSLDILKMDKENTYELYSAYLVGSFPEFSKIAIKFEKDRQKKYGISKKEMDVTVFRSTRKKIKPVNLQVAVTKYVQGVCIDKSKVAKLTLKNRLLQVFSRMAPKSNEYARMSALNDVSEVEVEFNYYISVLDGRFEKELAKRTIIGRVSGFFSKVFIWLKEPIWKKSKKSKKPVYQLNAITFRRK
jgi:hypothetical protein